MLHLAIPVILINSKRILPLLLFASRSANNAGKVEHKYLVPYFNVECECPVSLRSRARKGKVTIFHIQCFST